MKRSRHSQIHDMRGAIRASRVRSVAIATILILVVIPAVTFAVTASDHAIERVNVSSAGVQGNLEFPPFTYGYGSAVTRDGRYVVFSTAATTLVPGDTNNSGDVFLRDLESQTTTRVSLTSADAQAEGDSFARDVAEGGNKVVFQSSWSGWVAGDENSNDDVFMRNLADGTTSRIVMGVGGAEPDNGSFSAEITPDAGHLVFTSDATNIVADDTNNYRDVFVRDLASGANTRVSVSSDEVQADEGSDGTAISDDGRYVAFISSATNLVSGDTNGNQDAFVRDLQTGTTVRVSVSSGATEAAVGVSGNRISLSANGRYVAFDSYEQLDPVDTNAYEDTYVHDTVAHTTVLASRGVGGVIGNYSSGSGRISPDGTHIAFISGASNLLPGTTSSSKSDVFVRNLQTGTIRRASVNSAGQDADLYSAYPAIGPNGDWVVFESAATNLVTGDTNALRDLFAVGAKSSTALKGPSSPPTYKGSAKLTASIETSSGIALAGRTVVFERWTGSAWQSIGTAQTNAAGVAVKYATGLTSKQSDRARFAAAAPYVPSVSATVIVKPYPSIGSVHARSTMSRYRYYGVYGYLKPRHTAGTYPVRIYKWKKTSSGKWKSYGYVKARAYNYSTYTKYYRKIRLPYAGKWRLRAYAPTDSKHTGRWSKYYDYVTVK